jgi:tRNA(Ile)-lysidine synthase
VALAEGIKASSSSDITLSAATIDHGLRAESADEGRQVAAFCARAGIRHVARQWKGEKPGTGLMAAAREVRYALLVEAAAELCADVIVTAHTLDDQRETLAMRAERQSGGSGLPASGIADAVLLGRRIWAVRPFLGCRRDNIRQFLSDRGIDWIDDPSNEDPHYERVRMRKRLANEAPAAQWDDGSQKRVALSAAAAVWVEANVAVHAAVLGDISRDGLAVGEPAVAYALAYLTAVFGGKAYPPGQAPLQRVLAFLAAGQPGRRTLSGVVFDLRREGLYLIRENRGIATITIPPGTRKIWDGRFEIANNGNAVLDVGPSAGRNNLALPAGLPKGVQLRARAAEPRLHVAGEEVADMGKVLVTPYLAPFDHFLTCFDLTLADRLAVCFGRTQYLPLPF